MHEATAHDMHQTEIEMRRMTDEVITATTIKLHEAITKVTKNHKVNGRDAHRRVCLFNNEVKGGDNG